ncbi:LysR family transcriptional regulator [Thiomicrorhabdus sp. Milos-T2]|uniref:LysR family transcriptional regulator n=1 Tax=Thiomicrorhabdus sp. Milos-T2 TaxID=90814 RepID=UPI000494A72F|nr:LysR family transcriptional regulator [Thiomicrorhabdus sp. Milos-T2]
MNIEHLKLFIRIAALLNISKAGQELGLSPAVASAHISKLEEMLGTRLLSRSTRKISLTEEGRIFLPHAQEILESVEQAKGSIGIGNRTPSGTIRLTAPASFGRQHLLPAITDFLKDHPQITIDLSMTDIIMDVIEGGFDVAIRIGSLKDSNLIARKIAEDNRVICASPDYLNEHNPIESLNDLKQHDCINLRGLDVWYFKNPESVDEKPIAIKTQSRLMTDNGEVMRDATVAGLGLSINSTWNCYQQIQSGQLQQTLENVSLSDSNAIWAVYPTNRLVAPKVRLLIDYLIKRFGKEPYWDKSFKAKT